MPRACSWLPILTSSTSDFTRVALSVMPRTASAMLIQPGVAVARGRDRFLDQPGGVAGRLGAALRQVAHLVGDYRKPQARLARAGRFHRGVQRQDVGLEGDLVDHFDDAGDLVAGTRRFLSSCSTMRSSVWLTSTAPFGGLLHQAGHLQGMIGVLAGNGGDLFGGSRGLFQRGRLFGSALRQRLAGTGDLRGGAGHLLGALAPCAPPDAAATVGGMRPPRTPRSDDQARAGQRDGHRVAARGFGRGAGAMPTQIAILLFHQRRGLAPDLLQAAAALFARRSIRAASICWLGHGLLQFLVGLRHR